MCFSAMVEQDKDNLTNYFGADFPASAQLELSNLRAFEQQNGPDVMKNILGLTRKPGTSKFKGPEANGRIFPGSFTDVMIMQDGKRCFVPMRYRVRPAGMPKEIPSKFNVFNARRDSLQKARTWKPLFGQKHAIFPFVHFYEWVQRSGKKTLIHFSPENCTLMWAACLYDEWISHCGNIKFRTFAMVTDEPPPEVAAAGHDRCPIFLHKNYIDDWLSPAGKSKDYLHSLLDNKQPVQYKNQIAA